MPDNMLITENQGGHFFNQLTNSVPSRNTDFSEAVLGGGVVAAHQVVISVSKEGPFPQMPFSHFESFIQTLLCYYVLSDFKSE